MIKKNKKSKIAKPIKTVTIIIIDIFFELHSNIWYQLLTSELQKTFGSKIHVFLIFTQLLISIYNSIYLQFLKREKCFQLVPEENEEKLLEIEFHLILYHK